MPDTPGVVAGFRNAVANLPDAIVGPADDRPVATHASSGYAGAAYVASLTHVGTPLSLDRAGGWCLLRSIAASGRVDATGPYPVLVCADWGGLADDLADLAADADDRGIVSVTAVTDPLADIEPSVLDRAFPDLCRPYKAHHVVDLTAGPPPLDEHHRRNVRLGRRDTTVEITEHGGAWADDWLRLYAHLVARHSITGPAAFPPESLRRQLAIPGLLAVRALHDGGVVGMTLWALHEDRAYYHLGAYDETGYRVRAAYAMFAEVLAVLASRGIRRVGLGAGAGTHTASAGLERFKHGWATGTAPVHLCGRILDRTAYARLCADAGVPATAPFFPAYRSVGGAG